MNGKRMANECEMNIEDQTYAFSLLRLTRFRLYLVDLAYEPFLMKAHEFNT